MTSYSLIDDNINYYIIGPLWLILKLTIGQAMMAAAVLICNSWVGTKYYKVTNQAVFFAVKFQALLYYVG